MTDESTRSPYVQRLPIGERIPFPADGIPYWEIFPFEGDLQVKVLEPHRYRRMSGGDAG